MNPTTPPNGGTDFLAAGTPTPQWPRSTTPTAGVDRTPSSTTTAEQPKPTVKDTQDPSPQPANRSDAAAPRPRDSLPYDRPSSFTSSAEAAGEARDAWIEGVRSTIRSNPLGCVAAALACGAVITRITR